MTNRFNVLQGEEDESQQENITTTKITECKKDINRKKVKDAKVIDCAKCNIDNAALCDMEECIREVSIEIEEGD